MLRIHTCHRYRIISMSSHLRDIQQSMRIFLAALNQLDLTPADTSAKDQAGPQTTQRARQIILTLGYSFKGMLQYRR